MHHALTLPTGPKSNHIKRVLGSILTPTLVLEWFLNDTLKKISGTKTIAWLFVINGFVCTIDLHCAPLACIVHHVVHKTICTHKVVHMTIRHVHYQLQPRWCRIWCQSRYAFVMDLFGDFKVSYCLSGLEEPLSCFGVSFYLKSWIYSLLQKKRNISEVAFLLEKSA